MIRTNWVIALFTLAAIGLVLPGAATAADATVTVNGWIVDEACGASNAKKGGEECARDCHEKGSALVLYDEKSEKIYRLDDQKLAAKHIGYVKITGTISGETFKVEKIEAIS
jgi:hypothetical protein